MKFETALLGVAFALFAVPASVVDLSKYRVPDICTIGGTLTLLGLRILAMRSEIPLAIAGPLMGGTLFMLVRVASGGRLGLGDVKLSMLVGATTGPLAWLLAVALGSALAALWACVAGLRAGEDPRSIRIPYAPFLTIGTFVSLAISGAAAA